MPNTSLIHADIFFFISTIALVVISVGLIVALFYFIRILRDASFVSKKIKEESTELIADLRRLREGLKEEGVKWRHVSDMIRNFFRFQEAGHSASVKVAHGKKAVKRTIKKVEGVVSRIFS